MFYRLKLLLAMAVPLLLAAPVAAQENPDIDPKATQVLKEMSGYLGNLSQFSFQSTNAVDVILENGQEITLFSSSRSLLKRPDRLMSERLGEKDQLQLFYDGQTVTLLELNSNHYAQQEFDGNLYEMLEHLRDSLEIELPAADLLYPDAYEGLMETAEAAIYVGTVELDGVLCHHLAFRAEQVDWQLWVEVGERPLPRRYSLVSKWVRGSPEFTVLFQEWETATTLSDSMFRFKAPQGAKEIVFGDSEK